MKKKVLILGASGMLGSVLFFYLSSKKNLNIYGTARDTKPFSNLKKIFKKKIIYLDLKSLTNIEKIILQIKPDFIINCTGVIKQKINLVKTKDIYFVNSIVPKFLSSIAKKNNYDFLQISTDCVFSGSKGRYKESDVPDAYDLYSVSKLLGEVKCKNSGTIRTSIIGHELRTRFSLLEWFLSQTNKVNGFENVFFSGFTTLELSKLIYRYFIMKKYFINKIYHLSSMRISKYRLLCIIKNVFNMNIKILKKKTFFLDRSLNSALFKKNNNLKLTFKWNKMIKEMKKFKKISNDRFYE
jgi:dTDP-4-dehydrorhamnose reductase